MANTLSLTVSLQGSIAGQSFPAAATVSGTPATSAGFKETATVSGTAAIISSGSVANVGYMVIQNLDATNSVAVSMETTAAINVQTILVGGVLVLSPGTVAVYGKCAGSNTAQITVTAIST